MENNKKLWSELKIKNYPLKEQLIKSYNLLINKKIINKVYYDEILDYINKHQEEKLSVFIKKFIDNNQFCGLFQDFYFTMADNLQIYDFTGKKFIKYI